MSNEKKVKFLRSRGWIVFEKYDTGKHYCLDSRAPSPEITIIEAWIGLEEAFSIEERRLRVSIKLSMRKQEKAMKDFNKSLDKTAGVMVRLGQPFKAYHHKFFPNELVK